LIYRLLFIYIFSIFLIGCGSATPTNSTSSEVIVSTNINIAPITLDDTMVLTKNSSSYIYPLRNDSDENNDSLTLINLSKPLYGKLEKFDTYIRYIPNHNFVGTETIYYRVTDGKLESNMSRIVITIIDERNAPIGNPDYFTVNENSRVNIDILSNDVGDDLIFKNLTSPVHGTLSINQNIIVYQPDIDFIGDDEFYYTPSNGVVDGNITSVHISIEAINEVPVARDDSVTINENEFIIIDVLDNDYDLNGDNIFIHSVTQPRNGLTYIEDNKIKYIPNKDFFGEDSFEYTPHDGKERGESGEVNITVLDINQVPMGVDDNFTVVTQRVAYLDILSNDIDDNNFSITNLTQPQNGRVLVENGKVKYISNVGFLGTDSFSYTPNDGTIDGNITSVMINVLAINPQNVAPIGVDDTLIVSKNSSANIDVFENDIDDDNLSLFYINQPLNGEVEVLDSGELKYTPNHDFVGSDEFKYIPSDGEAIGEDTVVRVSVVSTNAIPVGVVDNIEMEQDRNVTIDVLANDIDDDNLSILSITTPSNGTAIIQDNKIIYTPNSNYMGKDTISYIPKDTANNEGRLTRVDIFVLNPNKLSIKGLVSFDRVPVSIHGLNYDAITSSPARGITVKLFDNNAQEVATATTDANGYYRFDNLDRDTLFQVKVYAQMKSRYYEIEVVDNTQNNAKYLMEGSLVALSQDTARRDFYAPSGWNNGYKNPRVSAPYAILDTIYKTLQKIIDINLDIDLGRLQVNWSILNKAIVGDKSLGEIGTSYYDRDRNLWILGDANRDTDEYDIDVITHEFGHFIKSKLSRQDSIGGEHSETTKLDIRVAYEEGWCNAFAGIVHNKPIFVDTMGENQQFSSIANLEENIGNNNGWFSEGSVQRIIYDLFDSNSDEDDELSLGFEPLFNVATQVETEYPAFLSIFTFIYGLKMEYPELVSKIDKLVANENISSISDYFGDNRENSLDNVNPIYKNVDIESKEVFCTETTYGIFNKILNRVLIKFNIPSRDRYRVNVKRVYTTTGNPQYNLYQTNPISKILTANSSGDTQSKRIELETGAYILDLYDYDNATRSCFEVEIKEAAFYDIF